MPVETRKRNADTHPGHVILKAQRVKRTRKQIEEDDAIARAEARASKMVMAAKQRATVERIAQLEDEALQAEKQARTWALRPDIHSSSRAQQESFSKEFNETTRKALGLGEDSDDSTFESDSESTSGDGHPEPEVVNATLPNADSSAEGDEDPGPASVHEDRDASECHDDMRTIDCSEEEHDVSGFVQRQKKRMVRPDYLEVPMTNQRPQNTKGGDLNAAHKHTALARGQKRKTPPSAGPGGTAR